jgi:YesN/AraC family two-component response regulator
MIELKNLKILYVEDEDRTRESMCRILNKFFGEVVDASDGEDGFTIFKSQLNDGITPDIIISDINMPKMNGLEMVKAIREIDKEIPIVLLTAHSEANYLLEAINLKVSEYVIKPMNMTILFEKLQSAYLPIYQKKLLEIKNLELEQLNEKIKEIAKQELAQMKEKLVGDDYVDFDDDIDFGNLIDNIKLE